MPSLPTRLLLFLFVLGAFIALVQLSAITLAFDKLGLSPDSALLLLVTSILGSFVNLPVVSLRSAAPPDPDALARRLVFGVPQRFLGKTIIAVNVGGCLIPLFFSVYLFSHNPLDPAHVAIATVVVSTVSYVLSRPVAHIGIGMPMLVAPVTAALVAILIGGEFRAVLAYISGVMGVLIGADLLRLRDVLKMGAPVASIGGAGTFDGIFITGLIAVLLT
jgi:uncharacterized membrane protein